MCWCVCDIRHLQQTQRERCTSGPPVAVWLSSWRREFLFPSQAFERSLKVADDGLTFDGSVVRTPSIDEPPSLSCGTDNFEFRIHELCHCVRLFRFVWAFQMRATAAHKFDEKSERIMQRFCEMMGETRVPWLQPRLHALCCTDQKHRHPVPFTRRTKRHSIQCTARYNRGSPDRDSAEPGSNRK